MYYVKMTFTPFEKIEITESNVDDMDMSGDIWSYLGELLRNGQICKDTLIYSEDVFQAFFFVPELDSLDEKNCDASVLSIRAEIKKRYVIAVEVLGQNAVINGLCSCKDPAWYILYARSFDSFSPIVCGDCLQMIPAYKLSHAELPKNCPSAIGWLADYSLIDKLWLYSNFDRFTYRQVNDPKSTLSKYGRKICAAYEKALGKPFYYFLFYFDCQDASISREKCPVCGGDWMLEEKIGSISFKCDKCRLVSY